eukprot:TRINITY_DN1168_c0_g2_i2.p1 TRINITY_DN1168_c0_g2~~TRINITY_DN1168_c0_g2_i2.p1  ORF type:complete len:104 (-),score=48.31 TRINITY_DN1168_c0_g2_i2:323-634(-)
MTVAKVMMELYNACMVVGDFEKVNKLVGNNKAPTSQSVRSGGGNSQSDSSDDDDDMDEDMKEADVQTTTTSSSSSTNTPTTSVKKPEKVFDEDGFEVIVKRRR